MKKFTIAAMLAVAALSASATDIGLRAGRNTSNGIDSVGIVADQKLFGNFGIEGAVDRTVVKQGSENRFSLLGTYDFAKVVGVTFTAKAGAAIIEPKTGLSGSAALAGIGASYPLGKNVSLVVDYAYERGQSRISGANGNQVSVGVKYSF